MSLSPGKLILNYKMEYAKDILRENSHSIEETAIYCGFSGITNFSRKFKQEFGLCPSKYREDVMSNRNNLEDWKLPLNKKCFDRLVSLKTEIKWLDKFLCIVIDNLDNEFFSVEILSSKLFMSKSNLNRKVKAVFGCSTIGAIRDFRLQYAIELIIRERKSITEAASLAGFFDIAHFSHFFKQKFGCPPSKYRNDTVFFPFVNQLKEVL